MVACALSPQSFAATRTRGVQRSSTRTADGLGLTGNGGILGQFATSQDGGVADTIADKISSWTFIRLTLCSEARRCRSTLYGPA